MTDHHGFILVDSVLEKGTTFTVYLPVPQDAESLEISTDRVKENIAGGNETILIVEDEEMVLDFLKEVLEERGYHVVMPSTVKPLCRNTANKVQKST
ncbi:MAG: hypothetical protein COT43_08125 [Candidatus Marinimicrobia bacterium CG08_land_8_20_14_0_20_45_22]|nr:MAG: hypothetical protein COT43_08125 [Candidatus Marinimicrobia bacterium CG08_land_8_20_14_0_20_45_22]